MFYSDYFQFLSKDMSLFLRLSGGKEELKLIHKTLMQLIKVLNDHLVNYCCLCF